MRVVFVRQADDHVGVRDAGQVEVEKDFEIKGSGLGIELVQISCQLGPVRVPATIVDGEGVDSGAFGKSDVVGVVAVGRLLDQHVVGEDKRAGRASFVQKSTRRWQACYRCRKEDKYVCIA